MTTLHVHELNGLKPDVLATYLAALGVLRLLAEQKDASARGFWRNEHFVLVSEFDWKAIERFFLEDYAPTPILAPWNLESGFFSPKSAPETSDQCDEPFASGTEDADCVVSDDEGGEEEADETDQAIGDPVLDHFASSSAGRFESFRRAIEIARIAIPEKLRRVEQNLRRAHDEMTARSADERTKHKDALKEVDDAERDVARFKADVEARKTAIRRVARESPEHEALEEARERLKAGQEQLKIFRKRVKDLEKELKASNNRAKGDKELKRRIAEAKAAFKEAQQETKHRLIADLRADWGTKSQQWVDAAVALDERGEAGFTSLFGSGGNDGRMEYTKNFRWHLHVLLDVHGGDPPNNTTAKLDAALFGTPTNLLVKKAVGQLFPGRAGGTNMGTGFYGGAGINSWEFVLMLEGAVALVAGMSRRGDVDVERARVSSPFWVQGASAGFGSASEREDNQGGEQWLPLWSRPLCYDELVELIREGRAQIRHRQTTRAADLVCATARLGLARGIDSLQRFAYLKRNGKSRFAVSTGRFRVASRSHQALLDDGLASWIDRLVRQAREKKASMSLGVIARRTQEALFTVCRQEATPTLWRELLVTLGEAELVLLRGSKNPLRRPLPPLSSEWLAAVDDGTPEGRTVLRLALALASQHRPRKHDEATPVDSVRRHFLPLDDHDKRRPRFKLDDDGHIIQDPEHVCIGRDLVTDAIALVERRSIWARSSSNDRVHAPRLPLEAVRGCEATSEEIAAWVYGEVSDEGVLRLVRPLLALDWNEVAARGLSVPPIESESIPDPLHMLFRLAHLPFDVSVRGSDGRTEAEVTVRLDPAPLRRLAAGDLDGALQVATRRLEASGLLPVFRRCVATRALGRRLAASLAFPISRDDAARAVRLVCKPYDVKDAETRTSNPV